MPNKLNPDGSASNDDSGRLSNTKARQEAMNASFDKLVKLDAEIKAMKAKHVQPIQDERTEVVRKLKADCDIDTADFKIFYALHRRKAEAEQMDDAADRDRILTNLRTTYQYMQDGGQLDWLTAVEMEDAA